MKTHCITIQKLNVLIFDITVGTLKSLVNNLIQYIKADATIIQKKKKNLHKTKTFLQTFEKFLLQNNYIATQKYLATHNNGK